MVSSKIARKMEDIIFMDITIKLWIFILLVVATSILVLISSFVIIIGIISSVVQRRATKKFIEEQEKYKNCPDYIESPDER